MGRSLIYTSHYMEEVERLADHLIILDHGKVLADATPAALFTRLPAQAALHIELEGPVPQGVLDGLCGLQRVHAVRNGGAVIDIDLAAAVHALPIMAWLERQGCRATHFATARASLEDVFLTLTGRSLRD